MSIFALGADGPWAGTPLVPTRVPDALVGKPIGEVVEGLGRASGFRLRLLPTDRVAAERPVKDRGVEEGPTFWEVLDRSARLGRLEVSPRLMQEGPTLELEPVASLPARSIVAGAFRISLVGLVEERRVLYGDPFTEVSNSTIREPVRMAGEGLPSAWERSLARFLILVEPRDLVDIQLAGPPKVDEAVDDRGRSAIAASPKFENPSRYSKARGLISLDVHVPLDFPDPPGRSLRRLRGSIPVVAWVGHPQPLDVDLSASAARTWRGSGVNVEVLAGKARSIVLVMRPAEAARPASPGLGLFESGPDRVFLDLSAQFEVSDADGGRIEVDVKTGGQAPAGSYRVTLTPKPGGPDRVATRLRFRGLSWSRTDVPFDFDEVPLP